MTQEPENSRRDHAGRWVKGSSGNPQGPPRGSRHRTTIAIEALLEGEAEGLTRKAIELALGGDTTALRLCLERLCPPQKGRPVQLQLPAVYGASDVSAAMAVVVEAVSAGEITPDEATAVAGVLEVRRRAIETQELEARIARLEQGAAT